MKKTYICELHQHVDQSVQLTGWVYNLRSSGKVRFILLRDGTGIAQCILAYSKESQNLFDLFERLTSEATIKIDGKVQKWKDSFEILVSDFQILSKAEPFPITKKEHGIDFLMNLRHLWVRSKRPHAILRIRHHITQAIHLFFNTRNFTLSDPPIFTPTACEGTSTLFEVKNDEDNPLFLSQSGQMYLEAVSAGFNKVYCVSPTFRAEKSSTRRHLMEFWMCEAEMAFCDLNQNMDHIENFITFITQYLLKNAEQELKFLDANIFELEKVQAPFPRMHYKEALEHLLKKNPDFKIGSDFRGRDETILSSLFDQPLFIHHYPRAIKAFYMKQDSKEEEYCLSCDLLAPNGYGEILGGGQREDRLDILLKNIEQHQLNQKDFEWYLDLRRYGTFKHSGFGLGIERFICWICQLDHVREAIPFPRVYGRHFFEHQK